MEATLKKASGLRRALATNLLAAAAAYVQARRVVQGLDLQYAIEVGRFGRAAVVSAPGSVLQHGSGHLRLALGLGT